MGALSLSQFLQQQKLSGDDKHLYSGHQARVPPSGSSANPAEHRGSGQGRGSGPANARRAASAYPEGSPGALLSTARAWPRPGAAPPREAVRPAHPPPCASRRALRGRRPRLRLPSSLPPAAQPPADPPTRKPRPREGGARCPRPVPSSTALRAPPSLRGPRSRATASADATAQRAGPGGLRPAAQKKPGGRARRQSGPGDGALRARKRTASLQLCTRGAL